MGKEKKHSREKKHKKKHKKDKKKSRSSSSSSESEGEWVEKGSSASKSVDVGKSFRPPDDSKDDWGSIFSGVSTNEIRKAKEAEKQKDRVSLTVQPGQSSRELNPYWKDGGTGLPPERPKISFKKPEDDDGAKSASRFKRPDDDDYGRSRKGVRDTSESGRFHRSDDRGERRGHSGSSSRGWRKKDVDGRPETSRRRSPSPTKQQETTKLSVEGRRVRSPSPAEAEKEKSPLPEPKKLTSDEINTLSAKILKAQIIGNTALAAKLKQQLDASKSLDSENTVILTQTDSRGYTRPVKRDEPAQGSKKKRKIQTHEDSKRVRYFADDDDFSLQDMYEKEKYSSARDQEESFMNLMGKEMARKDGQLALDDPFEETASVDDRQKKTKQGWDRAVREQQKKEKIHDECKWCFGAKRMDQNLVVKTKEKVYLSCPPFQSLTEGHCLIVPHSHVSCSTQLDEDVWDQIMDLRKELVRLFEKNDEDVVFFENASYLHKHPHMVIHCVPLPREVGDTAPIYFKKALLECESEWSDNKKVVDLAGRGLRKSVPKGLPYFFVDFGDQYGYAHVIEDQKLFPNNFAQEIIGGMLDLDHKLWRKQRPESEDQLNKNLKYLKDFVNEQ